MNGKQILLSLVLGDFAGLTAWALYEQGLSGMIAIATGSPMGIAMAVDLTIALTLACAWMWSDARSRGASAVPYLLLTCMTGSVGPLLYLIRRESALAKASQGPRVLASA